MGKVLSREIFSGVDAAAAEQHERHAVLRQVSEPDLGIGFIQPFQQTPRFGLVQIGIVVADVVRHQQLCRFYQRQRKVRFIHGQPEGIFQPFYNGPLILRLHSPERDFLPSLRVGLVKYIAQFVSPTTVHQ